MTVGTDLDALLQGLTARVAALEGGAAPTPTPDPPKPSQPLIYGAALLKGRGEDQTAERALAAVDDLKLNAVRIVEWVRHPDEQHSLRDRLYREPDVWAELDKLVAGCADRGLPVILDLSCYRDLLRDYSLPGVDLYAYDAGWVEFVDFTLTRTNTVSGESYRDDPTILFVSVAGEVAAPNADPPDSGKVDPRPKSTAAYTRFVEDAVDHIDMICTHKVSCGGLFQLDWNSGIDWQAVFGIVEVPAIHAYGGMARVVPELAAWCLAHGKTLHIEECGISIDEAPEGSKRAGDTFCQLYAWAHTPGVGGIGAWAACDFGGYPLTSWSAPDTAKVWRDFATGAVQ